MKNVACVDSFRKDQSDFGPSTGIKNVILASDIVVDIYVFILDYVPREKLSKQVFKLWSLNRH